MGDRFHSENRGGIERRCADRMARAGPDEAEPQRPAEPGGGGKEPLRDASEVSGRARGRRCPVKVGRSTPGIDSPQPSRHHKAGKATGSPVPPTAPGDSASTPIAVDRSRELESIRAGPVKGPGQPIDLSPFQRIFPIRSPSLPPKRTQARLETPTSIPKRPRCPQNPFKARRLLTQKNIN